MAKAHPASPKQSADDRREGIRQGVEAREAAFVEAYRVSRNGTQAAITAGFSPVSARSTASTLLARPSVREAIKKLDREAFKKTRRSVEATIEEIAVLSHSNIKKLFGTDGAMLHPLEWPDDIARAVSSIEVFEEFEGRGDARVFVGTTKKVKLHGKVDALKMKGTHQKLFVEQHEHRHTVVNELGDRLAKARARARQPKE